MKTILVLIITALSFTAFGQGNSVKPKEVEMVASAGTSVEQFVKKPVNQVQFEKIYSIESEIQRLLKLKNEYIELTTGIKADGFKIDFEQEKEPKAELVGFFVFKPIKQ